MVHACPGATWYVFLKRSYWILLLEFLRNGRGKPGLGQGFKVNWWKLHGFEISRGGTLRVTAAVHRSVNYVKQYEKCDPAARRCRLRSGEAKSRFQRETLNCEPDNLSYKMHLFSKKIAVENSAVSLLWKGTRVAAVPPSYAFQHILCHIELLLCAWLRSEWFKQVIGWAFAVAFWVRFLGGFGKYAKSAFVIRKTWY